MDFRQETVAGLAARVRSGALGARELVQHALDRITKVNDRLNAFVALTSANPASPRRAANSSRIQSRETQSFRSVINRSPETISS